MYKEMKRHSLLTILPWVLICIAAGAILLGLVTRFQVLTLIRGPELLDAVAEENLDGAYVTFDESRIVAVYASASAGDDPTTYYYILRYGTDKYVTLQSNAKQYENFSSALAQSESYYTGELDSLSVMGSVTGFVQETDGETVEMMAKQMESIKKSFKHTGLPGMDTDGVVEDHILAYTVRLARCGWMPYWFVWLCSILGLGLLALGIVLLALQFTGRFQKEVHRVLGASDHTAQEIEQDYAQAQVFDSIRLGDLFTWYYKGASAYAFPTQEIIWVYKAMYARASDKYRWGITVYLKDHTSREMYMPQDASRSKIIRAYQAKGLAFVSTYQSGYEKLLREDFDAFCQLAVEEKAERERIAREKAMWEQV